MKKARNIILIVLAFFISIPLCYYLYYRIQGRKNIIVIAADKNYRLTLEEKELLQEGDIILRRGDGLISSMINNLNHADYQITHCAFLTKRNNKWHVIHTVSSSLSDEDGVQIETLDKFTSHSIKNTLVVLRYQADSLTRAQFIDRANVYLEQHVPFDNHFNILDTTEFYCTELIYRVYLDVLKIDVFEDRFDTDKPDFLPFDVFLDRKKFDIIINHQGEDVLKYMKN